MHSLNQAQILLLFAAGVKERAKGAGIVMTALLKSQENIAAHDNGDMADDTVKIPQLVLPFKVEVVFHHLEKHLDIPPFAVDADDFLIRKVDPGGEDGQPLSFMAVADKHDPDLLFLFGFNNHTGQNPGLARPFLQFGEEPAQRQPLPLIPVKDLRHVLAHTNHRQMFAQGGEEGWESKPTVHQEVVGPDAKRQRTFRHGFQVLGGFGHGLQPAFVATATLVQLFSDPLQSLARLGRGAEDEIKRQETHPIRPAQGHELESFQASVGVVIVYPNQQFNNFGAGPVIGAVVDDQYLLTLFAGQYVHESNHHRHQAQQKLPPVITGILQVLVGAVLLEPQLRIVDDAPGKVDPTKRQGEDGGEHSQGFCSSQFAETAASQQSADLEIVQKGRNPVMQSFSLLLLLVVLSMVHLSLFFFDIIRYFRKSNVSESKRLFTLKRHYFRGLTDDSSLTVPNPKLEL